ncbi:hypothetical protein NOVOSPHI9U_40688 [Novosphingobium sp. 9U]|nr:hypothetical protein NOVOSPHI9U_40688 [Novosphingobium sp. 9U]
MQPLSSRVTVTERCPSEDVALLELDSPLLCEEADTELCDVPRPELCTVADAVPACTAPSSATQLSCRVPSAQYWILWHCPLVDAAAASMSKKVGMTALPELGDG